MMEKDCLLDPTFEFLDIESHLNEIQADVNRLISILPVEAIDDEEEREDESVRKIGISDFSTKPTNYYNLDVIIDSCRK